MKSAVIYALITVIFSVMVILVIDSTGSEAPQPQRSIPSGPQPLPSFKVQ